MGVARPLEAIFAISKVERPEDKDYSFSRLVVQQHIIPIAVDVPLRICI